MPERRTFVIVGGGLAGARAAEALRDEGFDGRVILVSAEPEPPYDRPPLSKGYLRGEVPRSEARVHADDHFYDDREIELLLGRSVERLRPADRTLDLGGGGSLRYDRLLLATGSAARRPPLD